jgi:hypothetical protein
LGLEVLFLELVNYDIIFYNYSILFSAFSKRIKSSATVYYLFTLGLFLICFALNPNLKDERDSPKLYMLGETLMISLVFEFPPKLYCSNRVSLESLYGMCAIFASVNALITLPSDDKLLLIFLA